MNTIAIKRIAWKEFRQQRVFLFAMVVVAILVFILALALVGDANGWSQFANRWPAMIIGLFTALYAAGCGATLFATEKEEGTFANLQFLPISSQQLLAGKLSVGFLTCIIACMTAVFAIWLSGSLKSDIFLMRGGWLIPWLKSFGLASIEFFAWSVFFSLLLKNPLVAATMGIAIASASMQSIALSVQGNWSEPLALESYSQAFWPRCVLVIALLAVDIWIGSRWLKGGPLVDSKRFRMFGKQSVEGAGLPATSTTSAALARPTRRKVFLRFTWQAIRSSWPLMIAYCFCLPLFFPFAIQSGRIEFALVGFMFAASLAGVFAFTPDKTSSGTAFLAHHGERPGLYWLANVSVWISWIVLINVLIACVILVAGYFLDPEIFSTQTWFAQDNRYNSGMNQLTVGMGIVFSGLLSLAYLTTGMILSFSAGQLCSILIDRRILAAITAIALCVPLSVWFAAMIATETWLSWSVFPLIAGFMVAGWVATRWWLSNRKSFARVTILCALLGLFWAGLGWKFVYTRVHEIPVVNNAGGYDRQPLQALEKETVDEMRVRFSGSLNGYTRPDDLFPNIVELQEEILATDISVENRASLEGLSASLQDAWKEFLYLYPDATMEQQLALASAHLAENRARIGRIADAIQFAASHTDVLQRMEPSFNGKQSSELDILPFQINDSIFLLQLDFTNAVFQGHSSDSLAKLLALCKFQTLHDHVYGRHYHGRTCFKAFDLWLSMSHHEPDDVQTAFDFALTQWLPHGNTRRSDEREYLEFSQAIQQGDWLYSNMTWESRLQVHLFRLFPWEKQRSQRLVDMLFHGRSKTIEPASGSWGNNTIIPERIQSERIWDLREQSSRYQFGVNQPIRNNHFLYSMLHDVLILKLATMIWQDKHGEIPQSLSELEASIEKKSPFFGDDLNAPALTSVGSYYLFPKKGEGDRTISRHQQPYATILRDYYYLHTVFANPADSNGTADEHRAAADQKHRDRIDFINGLSEGR